MFWVKIFVRCHSELVSEFLPLQGKRFALKFLNQVQDDRLIALPYFMNCQTGLQTEACTSFAKLSMPSYPARASFRSWL